jgi:hypothetical protein
MLSSIINRNMLALIVLIFSCIGVSIINSHSCSCCFPNLPHTCETMAIDLALCTECTSVFCANHVKGCQGSPQCEAICNNDSSSTVTTSTSSFTVTSATSSATTTSAISSSTTTPATSSLTTTLATSSSMWTTNAGSIIRMGLFMISASLILVLLVQLNF